MAINNIFANLKSPRNALEFSNTRGVTDFSNLAQFNNYESGYSFLIVVKIPTFLERLKNANTDYANMINSYIHILEYEFKGLDGIDNITADVSELTDNVSTMSVITKVNAQSDSSFTMTYTEKTGTVMTRVHELYLRGVRDPYSTFKGYHGLIDEGLIDLDEVGFDMETFQFLYINTDNTGKQVEKACLIVNAFPTTAETNIHNTTKGDISFKEINVEFKGFPIFNNTVDAKAKEMLDYLHNPKNPNRVVVNSLGKRGSTSKPKEVYGATESITPYSGFEYE